MQALKVLIVDDNLQMLEMLKSVLQSFGIGMIYTAYSGEEAFRIFCRKKPDLVITDWIMEPGDGLELAANIRNHQKSPNQYVPLILMTGYTEKRQVLAARDTGISEFLVKPFNARDLHRRIERIIERPKQFVRCENFFGPDRRRKKPKEEYAGPFRRKSDPKELRDTAGKVSSEIYYTQDTQKISAGEIDLR